MASCSRGVVADGSETACVNLRCIDNLDPDALAVVTIDGASR